MRNLEILHIHKVPLEGTHAFSYFCEGGGGGDYGGYGGGGTTVGGGNGGSLFAFDGQEKTLFRISSECDYYDDKRKCVDIQGIGDVGSFPNNVVEMQYVGVVGALFFAAGDGAFYQIRSPMVTGAQPEELFCCEQGIKSFSVSPDCRKLVILSKEKTLLVLSLPDLECLIVHDLEEEQEGGNSIVWRKDSRYFAVNVTCSENKREILIFDEDGTRYASTTPQIDEFTIVSHLLAWQPSGGLLACYGQSPGNGKCIVFFELNGLKRSFLQLPEESQLKEVKKIEWNAASDVLCIQCNEEIQLWTRNNYVWMVKKVISAKDLRLRHCGWDADKSYRLHIVSASILSSFDICHKYHTSSSLESNLLVSWNGRHIYCTPLRDNCAPPPYGFLQAEVDQASGNILDIIFSRLWDGFLCVTEMGEMYVFKRTDFTLELLGKLRMLVDGERNIGVADVDSWAWININTLLCAKNGHLFRAKFPLASDEAYESMKESSVIEFQKLEVLGLQDNSFIRLVVSEDESSVFLNVQEALMHLDLETFSITEVIPPHVLKGIGRSVSTLKILPFTYGSQLYFIFHDPASKQLYFASMSGIIRVFGECTSIFIFSEWILITTVLGTLEIIPFSVAAEVLKNNKNTLLELGNFEGKYSRKIEKGSIIVSCCLNRLLEPTLILQIIPRGNLETICPRPLLISSIRTTLQQGKYEKIMAALRRHRLDYRILMEEMKALSAPLEEQLRNMVQQVGDSHSLILLITDLDETDYKDCIQIMKEILHDVWLQGSDQGEENRNIEEAYLACLAKLGCLEEALKSRLIQGETQGKRELVRKRLKFLSYYCDNPNVLFDIALGTYDLELASVVADCLSKDPKEYVPILQELDDLPILKRQFKIDDKLRRYSKAVSSLVKDSNVTDHNVILSYMQRHRLFTDVIQSIEEFLNQTETLRSKEDLQNILQSAQLAYGQYLEEHAKYQEAVILYERSQDWDKALDCALKIGDWENALDAFYAKKQGIQDLEELKELCETRIVPVLEERKNYAAVAVIYETYLHSYSKAVEYWVLAGKWPRARMVSHFTKDADVSSVKGTLMKVSIEKKCQLEELTEEIGQLQNRWKIAKEAKAKRLLEGGDGDDRFSDADSLSSYSSSNVSSSGTGKTYRSSKNKRKLERKLYSMKEGSRNEDLGITAHLWNLLDKIQNEVKPETSEMVRALWEFGEDERAKEVGLTFDKLLVRGGIVVGGIWSNKLLEDEENLLEIKYRVPPPSWNTLWDKLCLHDPSSKAIQQHSTTN